MLNYIRKNNHGVIPLVIGVILGGYALGGVIGGLAGARIDQKQDALRKLESLADTNKDGILSLDEQVRMYRIALNKDNVALTYNHTPKFYHFSLKEIEKAIRVYENNQVN